GLGIAVGADGRVSGTAPAMAVAAKTAVQPQVQNWKSLPGGTVFTTDVGVREPVSLTFRTAGVQTDVNGVVVPNDSTVVVGAASVVAPAPGGGIASNANPGGGIAVPGRIPAPAGNIALVQSGAGTYLLTIHLGPASVLAASGATRSVLDFSGYHKAA